MVALTTERRTGRRENRDYVDPMAANATIYKGALVVLDAAGNANRGTTAAGLIVRGVAKETKVNGATAGVENVASEAGTFRFANSAAGDLIARAEIGDDCYIVDDQTVAKTSGGATRSIAGKIIDVDAAGVWVAVGIH